MTSLINQKGLIYFVIFTCAPILFQSCAPFSALPNSVEKTSGLKGLYSNDCDSTDSWGKMKLWSRIDSKYVSEEDSLFVHFEMITDNKIKARLKRKNETVRECILKGKFKEDNCYYFRKVFYVVPILPILWWYKNEQNRFYKTGDVLVYEYTYDQGGAFIIMAGGTDGNYKWRYRTMKE